jgi:hypothetical protein
MKFALLNLFSLFSLTIFSMSAVSTAAFGASGKLPPANDGSGRMQCAWYDAGSTEEHGPHQDQQECLALHHGKCNQMCFEYIQSCQVEGIHSVRELVSGQETLREVRRTYRGEGFDRYQAQDIGYRSCYQDYPHNESCRVTTCTEDSRRVR